MVEEIKKESDKAKHFYGTTDVIELNTLFRIIDNQPDYKSALTEIINYINANHFGKTSRKINEISKKYNLGGE